MKGLVRFACSAALLGLGVAGCASDREREFGSSVRHMVEGQTYDPSAPHDTMGGLDGQKAAQAMEGYHGAKKAATPRTPTSAVIVPTSQ